ncbi:phosphoglycerate dehydrogenase [Clostridium sp. YIM B02515]|uniref:Phosphoglycerate dehydrogenase n=1 Tax=Clostridium rhizosphaerae TaxID=2803861 RepID=A0ABS1T950_9CLOT|nr:phosphoglycerate dehydrogenase [Clostridium rhizosphaerae]MBL4935865.1 phosphoglycerate dehydrogenase [Clostridium rhizosphaerae]
MAVKVLFTYDYGKENMNKIRELGYEIDIADERNITYSDKLYDIKAMVCYNPFQTLDISRMKSLRWIQLSSIGIDQLPIDYVRESGIVVTNNRGGYSVPMGEWVVMNILQILKNSFGLYKNQMNKLWKMDTGVLELFGKTVGFIGTGTIAVEAAKRLQGFGVKILGLNTSGRDTEFFHKCFDIKEIDNMLAQCDIAVVTIPSTDETYHLLNEDRFNAMKQGTVLVNVARGNIIDEEILIKNLKNRRLRGAALDVFEEEPLNENSPLWNLDNIIITPHNSWISEMRNIRRWNVIHENLKRYIGGEELINKVNLEKGY